jgi:hypothetical protein
MADDLVLESMSAHRASGQLFVCPRERIVNDCTHTHQSNGAAAAVFGTRLTH